MERALSSSNLHLAQREETSTEDTGRSTATLTGAMGRLDQEAYKEFFRVYYKRLHAYLLAVSKGDDRHIEDALQLAFPKIVKHVKTYECEKAFWNWISQISRNCLIDTYRKEGTHIRTLLALDEDARFGKLRPPTTSERLAQLSQTVELLPASERELVESKYIEGQTYSEIAKQLGTTEKSVESKLSRIRNKLRKLTRRSCENE